MALVEGVLGELFGEGYENGLALLDMAVAELADGEHEAGKGSEVMALLGGDLEEADALGLVGAGTGEAEDPAMGAALRLSM